MSSKRLKITVNGKAFEVEVGDLSGSPVIVTVNGQDYTVDFEVADSAAATPAEAVAPAASVQVAAPAAAAASPTTASANNITAPMPGQIVEVFVKAGDAVETGQEVCSLEAMKMKNAIRTPRARVIASVNVQEGHKVAHGEVLVTFE